MIDWNKLQQSIGVTFSDINQLKQAFIHPSFINENPDYPISDNERLEFLGDAVLNLIAAETIYSYFPNLQEGELTELRVNLIREETLAQLAADLHLGDYLYLGKGEELSGGRSKSSNMANTLEAMIGSIFLDRGIETARTFIMKNFVIALEKIKTGEILPNYKALLQEFVQAKYKQLPSYRLINTSGPDHDKTFTVEVLLGDKILGTGTGKSKRIAETAAASLAYEKLITNTR